MGGGTSGQFTFPTHPLGDVNPTRAYCAWTDDLITLIAAATGNSPYASETTPDPDTYMDDTTAGMSQYRMDVLSAIVDSRGSVSDYGDHVDEAKDKADESGMFPTLYSSGEVGSIHDNERASVASMMDAALEEASDILEGSALKDMRDTYEREVKRTFIQAMSRMAAGMADINAVNSSAFVFGMANIEMEMTNNIDGFVAQQGKEVLNQYVQAFLTTFNIHMRDYLVLKAAKHHSRDSMLIGGVGQMTSMLATNLGAGQAAAHLQTEINRIRHVAKLQEHQAQLNIDQADGLWDIKLHQHGANMLAAAGGAAMIPAEMPKGQQVIGGASAGAGIGATVGSVVPGVGTAIGAGIGAGVGAIVSAFD